MDFAKWKQEEEARLFSYLQGIFGADGQHLVFEVAELAAPGAPLADPANETRLMGAAHRAVTAAGTQQLPLMDT